MNGFRNHWHSRQHSHSLSHSAQETAQEGDSKWADRWEAFLGKAPKFEDAPSVLRSMCGVSDPKPTAKEEKVEKESTERKEAILQAFLGIGTWCMAAWGILFSVYSLNQSMYQYQSVSQSVVKSNK